MGTHTGRRDSEEARVDISETVSSAGDLRPTMTTGHLQAPFCRASSGRVCRSGWGKYMHPSSLPLPTRVAHEGQQKRAQTPLAAIVANQASILCHLASQTIGTGHPSSKPHTCVNDLSIWDEGHAGVNFPEYFSPRYEVRQTIFPYFP